jgi:hypothetical protein
MSTTLSFYKNVVPVNKQRHAQWGIVGSSNFDFARTINSMPLTAVEIPAAAKDYAVVFARSPEGLLPIAITGLRSGENLYVDGAGQWQEKYIPAFVRRYPFVFSTSDDSQTLTLCLDEGFVGASAAGEGERLFTETGDNSPYLNHVIEFLQEYQAHFGRTKVFCQMLEELKLVEPMEANFKTPDGREGSLTGFYVVTRERLKTVPAERLAELAKTDELEMIYLHLHSMQNLRDTLGRVKPEAVNEAVAG